MRETRAQLDFTKPGFYRTRDGWKAEVTGPDGGAPYPIVGKIGNADVCWTREGHFWSGGKEFAGEDLVAKWEDVNDINVVNEPEPIKKNTIFTDFCPECGDEEYKEGYSNERECVNCRQSWFPEVNYRRAIAENLRDLHQFRKTGESQKRQDELDKWAMFAAALAQGTISDHSPNLDFVDEDGVSARTTFAEYAGAAADAMLAEYIKRRDGECQ